MTQESIKTPSGRLFSPNCKNLREPILLLPARFDIEEPLSEIAAHPEIWNRYGARKAQYAHTQMSDIWVRYNDYANFKDNLVEFNKEHISVWYPEAYKIPSIIDLCYQVLYLVGGKSIGGVLITKIPPGGQVAPHIDTGWHASYYEKFAVQLMGNDRQSFNFEGYSLSAEPGQLYTFDNSRTHWVTNDSDKDRMTLIICIRREYER